MVRRAKHCDTVAVIAHGEHVADVVPSGELDRLRDTVEVLSDTDLVRDLIEGLAERMGRKGHAQMTCGWGSYTTLRVRRLISA